MANSALFRGLTLARSLERVRQVETFVEDIASGRQVAEISKTKGINVFELATALRAYNNYCTEVDKNKATGWAPVTHLNHLWGFTTEQSKTIKQEAIAKAMIGVEIGKALKETEIQHETELLACADHLLLTYGQRPTWDKLHYVTFDETFEFF